MNGHHRKKSYKINFDGSRDAQGRSGAGYCIRDDRDKLTAVGRFNCGQQPILVAEARGLSEGVTVVVNLGLKNLEIEGDNLFVVMALNQGWTIPWEISYIIKDILKDLKRCNIAQSRHCFREVNIVADSLTKGGTHCNAREDW